VGLLPHLGGYLKEWRELFRPRDQRFLELLLREAELARAAGRLLDRHVTAPLPDFPDALSRLETEGDGVLEEIVRALRESLVAPLSGSDIYYLANALDDILDMLEDMAHDEAAFLGEAGAGEGESAWRDPHSRAAVRAFVQALEELPKAFEALFLRPAAAPAHLARLRNAYGEGKREQSLAYAALVREARLDPGRAFAHLARLQWVRQLLRRVEKIANALNGILANA
jgi:hypothetical protein